VDLEGHCLTIRGGKAKQREDVVPLMPELLVELQRVRPADAMPTAKVFPHAVTNLTRKVEVGNVACWEICPHAWNQGMKM
jgi:hypothetical protein